ncbi:MAG: hypothetical protein LIO56_06400 [Lachnospiraceae bacterium]|nr:hypothetical protein [Lachnospiraceae bacterium]
MKKKLILVVAAALAACTIAGCGKSNTTEVIVEEVPVEETTPAADTATAQPEDNASSTTSTPSTDTKINTDDMYVEGTVTYTDGSIMTVQDKDGKEYTYEIATAEMDLDDNGLAEGISVGVTSTSDQNDDGNYKATAVKELSDSVEEEDSPSSGSGSSGDFTVEGEVTYTDGSIMTVTDSDGQEYTYTILSAEVDVDDNGIFEGITVKVTADSTPNDEGTYTASLVDEISDPD